MACEVAGFLEQFPGAVDVVLLNSDRWTEYHKAIMEALTEGVRMFLRTHRHLPFEKVLDEFTESQPCAVSGALRVSLLYGRELFTSTTTLKLKMDIKGLIFKKPREGACSTIESDDADIVVIITRRGKGTERFARRVGLLCPSRSVAQPVCLPTDHPPPAVPGGQAAYFLKKWL